MAAVEPTLWDAVSDGWLSRDAALARIAAAGVPYAAGWLFGSTLAGRVGYRVDVATGEPLVDGVQLDAALVDRVDIPDGAEGVSMAEAVRRAEAAGLSPGVADRWVREWVDSGIVLAAPPQVPAGVWRVDPATLADAIAAHLEVRPKRAPKRLDETKAHRLSAEPGPELEAGQPTTFRSVAASIAAIERRGVARTVAAELLDRLIARGDVTRDGNRVDADQLDTALDGLGLPKPKGVRAAPRPEGDR